MWRYPKVIVSCYPASWAWSTPSTCVLSLEQIMSGARDRPQTRWMSYITCFTNDRKEGKGLNVQSEWSACKLWHQRKERRERRVASLLSFLSHVESLYLHCKKHLWLGSWFLKIAWPFSSNALDCFVLIERTEWFLVKISWLQWFGGHLTSWLVLKYRKKVHWSWFWS